MKQRCRERCGRGIVFRVALVSMVALCATNALVGAAEAQLGRYRLQARGLYVQFERRGFPNGYYTGQVIQMLHDFDQFIGRMVRDEVELQLDVMRAMGVNTITIELRTSDPTCPDCDVPFTPPECLMHRSVGFQWPQPTSTELTNLRGFFDLIHSKGVRIFLRLPNTHMEEQPRTNSETWLGAILGVVKDHPALDLILFEGNTHLIDSDGDGVRESCGPPAEPPLWLGPSSEPAQYVKWAIGFARSLGIPARKLSAEAVIGNFFIESEPPAGPDATDRHLWSPIRVLKMIFDALSIPESERTYAVSLYEQRKCVTAQHLPCIDADPHTWADETLQKVFATIGTGNGARVVAPEMGVDAFFSPVTPAWPTNRALESLISLMEKYGVEGGSFWRWVAFRDDEETPTLGEPVKRRGIEFRFTPTQKEVLDMGGFHLAAIPNGSFETDANLDNVPDHWAVTGTGTGVRYFLAGEPGQPEVPARGKYALRLVTGNGPTDTVSATSDMIVVTANTTYTTTAYLRFGWTGDPNPGGDPTTRPQVYVSIRYFDGSGSPSAVRTRDVFRFYQEDRTQGFDTFPLRYTTPSDASFVRIEVGAARNGLPMPITLDVDNLDGALDLPQVTLIPSGTRFRPGDTLILTVTVTPGATPRTVDAYLAVRLPDGTLLFFPSFTPGLQPVLTNWTVAAFSGEVFRHTFTGGGAAGELRLARRLHRTGHVEHHRRHRPSPVQLQPVGGNRG